MLVSRQRRLLMSATLGPPGVTRRAGFTAAIFILWVTYGCGGGSQLVTPQVTTFAQAASSVQELEGRLEQIRKDLKAPGMAAAISKDQQIVWAKGFGLADVENNIAASPTTTFHLASLTKTFCSTI